MEQVSNDPPLCYHSNFKNVSKWGVQYANQKCFYSSDVVRPLTTSGVTFRGLYV